ncbi:hypothetical protein GCM10010275_12240 [Streptomyces litmocidini]|uniref:hypothetical protein n=1 Tax=Streptomyces litmocidini TaxID=67318 RepID=UPI00167D354A|nr:hypothetical protein [Streptomyces litmocidini]GGU78960.1 hypothetical protein GCM10010275_12240 [Streptomyces litmocidini]
MTDLSTEPILTDPEPVPPVVPASGPAEETPKPEKPSVEHTAGGWPVVPLALTGANATVTLLAGAALAGGPVAAALAATGAVVLGATTARTAKTTAAKQARQAKAGRHSTASAGKAAGGSRGGLGGVPSQPRRGSGSATGSRTGKRAGASAASGRSARSGALRSASTSAGTGGRKAGLAKGAGSRAAGTGSSPVGSSGAGKPRGRLGQVKALREQARSASPSRAGRRAETTAARRQVADARRAAKTAARTTAAAKKGPLGRAVGKAAGRLGTARGTVLGKLRRARDTQAAGKVAERRAEIRKAPARARARKALRRSAARFQGRRLLAALLAGLLGIVGMVTTPLGRKLGWAWLQHPGRRLYARLLKQAADERDERDRVTRAELTVLEAIADAEAAEESEQIGDTAERPAGLVPSTSTSESSEGEIVSGFRFEEYAAEMEAAANSYEPESAMEILAMVEGLPAALTSVANVMRILAERADSEFPLEKEVADGFNDIFGALMSAVAVAEDMGPLFRTAHEQDIARHEDPRNGPEAEKGWNV